MLWCLNSLIAFKEIALVYSILNLFRINATKYIFKADICQVFSTPFIFIIVESLSHVISWEFKFWIIG